MDVFYPFLLIAIVLVAYSISAIEITLSLRIISKWLGLALARRDAAIRRRAKRWLRDIKDTIPESSNRREYLAVAEHLVHYVIPELLKARAGRHRAMKLSINITIEDILSHPTWRIWDSVDQAQDYLDTIIRSAQSLGAKVYNLDVREIDWDELDRPLKLAAGRDQVEVSDAAPTRALTRLEKN